MRPKHRDDYAHGKSGWVGGNPRYGRTRGNNTGYRPRRTRRYQAKLGKGSVDDYSEETTMRWYLIRLTTQDCTRVEKAHDPREACRQAFGVVYDRGQAVYKDIGTRQPSSLSAKWKEKLYGPDDWLPIPSLQKEMNNRQLSIYPLPTVLLTEGEYRHLAALLTDYDPVSQTGRDLLRKVLEPMNIVIDSINDSARLRPGK